MTLLPRILYAVPALPHVHLEIAKAIRAPSARENEQTKNHYVVKAAADDPEHPGWPAGAPGGIGGQFRPKNGQSSAPPVTLRPSSAAATIHPCGTAFSLCMQSPSGNNVWCWSALEACMKTGLPTIFPGGIVGRRK